MKEVETLSGLRREYRGVKTGCSGDTVFGAKALLFMVKQLDRIETALARRKPRPVSEWQQFFGQGVKSGKTAEQISREWRHRKE